MANSINCGWRPYGRISGFGSTRLEFQTTRKKSHIGSRLGNSALAGASAAILYQTAADLSIGKIAQNSRRKGQNLCRFCPLTELLFYDMIKGCPLVAYSATLKVDFLPSTIFSTRPSFFNCVTREVIF